MSLSQKKRLDSISEINCLERLVSEMTCYELSGTLSTVLSLVRLVTIRFGSAELTVNKERKTSVLHVVVNSLF